MNMTDLPVIVTGVLTLAGAAVGAAGVLLATILGTHAEHKRARRQELREVYAHFLRSLDDAFNVERTLRAGREISQDTQPWRSETEPQWRAVFGAYLELSLIAPRKIARATFSHLKSAYQWREGYSNNSTSDNAPPKHEDLIDIFRKDLCSENSDGKSGNDESQDR